MQEEKEVETINNRQVADSGGKIIFENPTLCSQLLSRYSGLEFLKGIKPGDIEDVTERFIPMFTEQRDADVVKKVHLSDEDVFIALIEHKSGVDYNVAQNLVDQLKERKRMALFDNYVGFDVQEEWRKAEQKHLVNQVCKKLKRGLSPDIIAAETEEDLDYINEICSVAMRPEYSYDVDKIFEALQESRKLTSTV